jgi:hypothetical protein
MELPTVLQDAKQPHRVASETCRSRLLGEWLLVDVLQ